jgi:hypothetical protein
LIRRPGYAAAALAVLLIEVAIALWVHDRWIRPHGGDVLAVVLVYLGLRAVTPLRPGPAAAWAFAIACLVEIAQWAGLAGRLGLRADSVAGTVLGTMFDWGDILAYGAGAIAVLLVEHLRR